MKAENYVYIFDTTLRDGEQSPGCTMTLEEKTRVARWLERLGVDVIEAGFPAASPGEVDSVREISQVIDKAQVAALCRTRDIDIEAAWEGVRRATHPRLHVFIATSALHMQQKLKLSPDQVLQEIAHGVKACRSLCASVEFSAEDATRSDPAFLREAFACAIENGASVLNIPDTVGYTLPIEYTEIVGDIVKLVGDRDVIISTHCHNDLGLAAANSLAAIAAGARQIECCINGIGERAGNAALEEVVMALKVRKDLLGCETGIDTRQITGASQVVIEVTGHPVQAHKPIVGRNAFAHEAGIHQHGVLTDRRTYEIMCPEDVGVTESKIVLGKHSGRHALQDRLSALGYPLSGAPLEKVFERFKDLSDKKKNVYDEDLIALVAGEVCITPFCYELVSLDFRSGTGTPPWARAVLRFEDRESVAEATGSGPVSAAFDAIRQCAGKDAVVLKEYQLAALTGETDAQARASLMVEEDGLLSRGQATHIDVVMASALAFVNALNHQMVQREIKSNLNSWLPPP